MSDPNPPVGFIAPEPADLAPLFPGYEIHNLIATGGMGAVYCAVQKSLDRTVALKILPMEFSQDATFCEGFEAEAKAMARLNHPNLIGVFDFGEVNGMLYIIMEYVPGKSVYHSAYGQAIDPAEVIRLVTGICQGLAHAHENGIIHRDIKPSNILLDLTAQPKIGDFGLARPIEWQVAEGAEIFGTPHYTAPEVVSSPQSVDYRADIFSVGVMLHELLTSKLPANDPRPASAIIRCDSRFDAIIQRATQPQPAARYASANEMANDLQAILTPVVRQIPRAAAVTPRRAYSTGSRKKSSSAPTVFFLLAAAASGIAAYVYHANRSPKPVAEPTTVVVLTRPPVAEKPAKKEEPKIVEVPKAPTQKEEPKPVEETVAVPEVVPEIITQSTPEPTAPTEPKSDVPAFFERARKIMHERSQSVVTAHQTALKNNMVSFGRDVKRQIRKMLYDGGSYETNIMNTIQEWKDKDSRVPTNAGPELGSTTYKSIVDEHFKKQESIDDALNQGMAPHSATYILGLEKQIERLKADNDTGAVALVEAEIAKTKKSPKYFIGLMTTGD